MGVTKSGTQLNDSLHIYPMEDYFVIKKNKIMLFAVMLKELETAMLKEARHKKANII